jgi:predicted TIM-barrel fold metal-dependent hydrolase
VLTEFSRRDFLSSVVAAALERKRPGLRVDCHAHVFLKNFSVAPGSQYAPTYDAPLDNYVHLLNKKRFARAVLVQPSFLGDDNTYLLAGLRQYPERFRGVVTLASNVSDNVLNDLDNQGVVGIRFNLISQSRESFIGDNWDHLVRRVTRKGWHVEIFDHASRLVTRVNRLLDIGAHVVVDHFGYPSAELGVNDPGFKQLLKLGATGSVWIKLTGWYRLGAHDRGAAVASAATPLLLEHFGPKRLLFGSDWPHTRFENVARLEEGIDLFYSWVRSEQHREQILVSNPYGLYRFI